MSNLAAACPNCGAPVELPKEVLRDGQAHRHRDEWKWIVGTIAVGIVALCVVIGMSPSKPPTPRIKAAIAYLDSAVLVTNHEGLDLKNCTITLNSDFRLKHISIAPKDTAILNAALFSDFDGKLFNPREYTPQSIAVECNTTNGERAGTFNTN